MITELVIPYHLIEQISTDDGYIKYELKSEFFNWLMKNIGPGYNYPMRQFPNYRRDKWKWIWAHHKDYPVPGIKQLVKLHFQDPGDAVLTKLTWY